jgi:hypothetical protein
MCADLKPDDALLPTLCQRILWWRMPIMSTHPHPHTCMCVVSNPQLPTLCQQFLVVAHTTNGLRVHTHARYVPHSLRFPSHTTHELTHPPACLAVSNPLPLTPLYPTPCLHVSWVGHRK